MKPECQRIYVELSSMSEATYRIRVTDAISALRKGPIALAFPIIHLTRPDDPLMPDITRVVIATMEQMVDDLSAFGSLSERPRQEGNYALLFFVPRKDGPSRWGSSGTGGWGAPVPKVPYPVIGAGEIALPLPPKNHEEL